MDLYEPIGNQKNVVDAPPSTKKAQQKQPAKDGPMMSPMKAPLMPPMKSTREQADNAAPLRDGDEVDLESEAGERVGPTGMLKARPKKSSMSTVNTWNATERRLQSQVCVLRVAAVIVIVLCSVFLVIMFVTVLHTARAAGFVKALVPNRCS